MIRMNVDDIRRMTEDFLTPATVAEVMRMDVGKLRYYARTKQRPFPVQESGDRIKIGRVGFLNWVDGKKPEPQKPAMERLMEELIRQMKIQNVLLTAVATKYAPASLAILADQIKEIEDGKV